MADPTKGAKLDFKQPGAAKYGLEYLSKTLTHDQELRIIINAIIIQGRSGNAPKFSTDFLQKYARIFTTSYYQWDIQQSIDRVKNYPTPFVW